MSELVRNLGRAYYERTATPDNLSGPVSKSLLWQFSKSPYKWLQGIKQKASAEMTFGSLVHALCFSPNEVALYAASPYADFRSKAAQEWRDEQVANGISVVANDEWQRAKEVAETVMESGYLYELGACEYEVAAFADIQGVPCKGMFDILPTRGNQVADLKTTKSIGDSRAIQRKIVDGGLHWQAAIYLDLHAAATGETRDCFEFLFVETEPPYELAVVRLTPNFIAKGREGYMNALARWVQCTSKHYFPQAIEGVLELDAPNYI